MYVVAVIVVVVVVAVEQIAVYLTNFFSTWFSIFRFQKCKNVQWLSICSQDTDKQLQWIAISDATQMDRYDINISQL